MKSALQLFCSDSYLNRFQHLKNRVHYLKAPLKQSKLVILLALASRTYCFTHTLPPAASKHLHLQQRSIPSSQPLLRVQSTTVNSMLSLMSPTGGGSESTAESFPYVYDGNRQVPSKELPTWMLRERTRVLTVTKTPVSGNGGGNHDCVVYWMQRDVRTVDNWALLLAQHFAHRHQLPLRVVYVLSSPLEKDETTASKRNSADGDGLPPPPPLRELRWTERHGRFLLGGLQCVHEELAAKKVPFHVLHYTDDVKPWSSNENNDSNVLNEFMATHNPSVVICDTNVLRHTRRWNESPALREDLDVRGVPLYQVDAHNVVPVWLASSKREVGARTLRSKLHKLVDQCLQGKDYKNGAIPDFFGNNDKLYEKLPDAPTSFDYDSHKAFLQWDESVKEVLPIHLNPGTDAAWKQFEDFCSSSGGGLRRFSMLRNNPNNDGVCSSLSPWFNYGHLSFASCIRYLQKQNHSAEGKAAFIEEGFVRRELSDNFLWYAPDTYDSLRAGAQWAQDSLRLHISDSREYVYNLKEFETGKTHDDLWNAAQIQMVNTGKMHGFLRMYWAKKILEWTTTPDDALQYAQYLNDKYSLDGRDPNGFAGVAWSIYGNHDMGWKEREIFGKIRFMNYNGCKRKFKVDEFIRKYPPASKNALIAAKTHNQSVSRTSAEDRIKNVSSSTLSSTPPPPKRFKTNSSDEKVEDLHGLSKSALSKKTVKVLRAFVQSKGESIIDEDGKNLTKARLVEKSLSL